MTQERMARKNAAEIKKRRKRLIITKLICALLAVLCLIGGVASLAYYKTLTSIGYQDVDTQSNVVSTDADGSVIYTEPEILTLDTNSGNLLSDPYVLNVLLFGADQYGDSGNSDTIILMSIDNRHEKIKLTSFLRDTYISIPGYYSWKLNGAYALGGAELSIKTIEANFGIKIDRYAVVNFETFKDIVDIMDGVDIELTYDEIQYINAQVAQNGQDDYLPWDTEEGIVHLNGQQALWHARNRGGYVNGQYFYMGDDWGRVERQRAFLDAVMDKLRSSASLTDIVQIVNAVGPNITTNLKSSEVTTLVAGAITYLGYDMEELSMPEDNWESVKNEAGDCLAIVDWNLARRTVAEFIYEESVI
ncbi:MAG: LCP family protein [Ruminococcus sp.]|nr:LCP family protein [Ruminococcus sp.]MDO4419196.1 LCP family protein [Ruminococcus sp.]